ncbi:cell cycle checkpoint protein RAD1-like [Convolutriloba macropyga]|uniref:cell cycle checkpoint protein RAD1-like n=1 Tax=Convolutriloba macropyga TaxID=536237 RepID=UPI003F52182C
MAGDDAPTQLLPSASNCLFWGRLGNARILSSMLRCVQFSRVANFNVSENGLKVTAEVSSCVQANAFLQKEIFDEFSIQTGHSEVSFCLNVEVLIQCLNIYTTTSAGHSVSRFNASSNNSLNGYGGGNPSQIGANQTTLTNFIFGNSVVMYYLKEGDPLCLIIEESSGLSGTAIGSVITDCQVRTLDTDEAPLDLHFPPEDVINKVIMNPSVLYERVSELDLTADFVQIELSPVEPYFSLTTKGNLLKVTDKVDQESGHILSYDVKKYQQLSYRSNQFKLIHKTLQCCTKVSIRTNEDGFVCIQFMVRFDNCPKICFVEFFFAPVEQIDI